MAGTFWKILLVDDDEDDYLLTRQMLAEARRGWFELEWASSYSAAQEILHSSSYDAVLMDYDLGGRTGIDLIRESGGKDYPAPFILLTGRGSYEVDVEAMRAGATLYLNKGEANPLLLERSIRYAIERKHSEEALRQANQELKQELERRRQAEGALRETEERFRRAVESFPYGFVVYDAGRRYIYVNHWVLAAAGLEREQILGRRDEEIWPEEVTRQYLPELEDVYRAGESTSFEFHRHERAGGGVISASYTPVTGPEEKVIQVLAVFQDITVRQQAEAERDRLLKEAESQRWLLEMVVENMPTGLAVLLGPEHIYDMVNPAQREIARSKGELVGRSAADVWPEIAGHDALLLLDKVYRSGRGEQVRDLRMVLDRGEEPQEAFFNIDYMPLIGRSEEVAGILLFMTETTAQIQARRQLEEVGRAAAVSFGKLDAVFRSLSEGVSVFDLEGRILEMNPAGLNILGFSSLEEARRHYMEFAGTFELYSLEGHFLAVDEWPVARVLRGEAFSGMEVEVHRKDTGLRLAASYSGRPVRDDQGHVILGVITIRDISESKASERELHTTLEALKTSEERYRTLFTNMLEGFAVGEVLLDDQGRPADIVFLDTNAAFEQQTGLGREILGQPLTKVLPNLEHEWIERYGNVALSGDAASFTLYNQDTNRTYDVFSYQPAPGRFAILFRDITQQKQAEDALRLQEAFLRQMIESLPGLVWTTRADGMIDYLSTQWLEYTGTSFESQLGEGAFQSLHPEDVEYVREKWRAATEDRDVFDVEYRLRRYDGVYHWFKARGTPIRDADGQIVRWFGMSTDIDEMKKASEELSLQRERLELAQAASHSGSFDLDLKSGMMFWSDKLHEIYGFRAGEFDGRFETSLERVLPADRAAVESFIREAYSREASGQFRIRRKYDGRVRWMEVRGRVLYDREGRPERLIGTGMDISERKKAEQDLATYAAQLERSNQELQEFAFIASHDMQEPLRKIETMSSMIVQTSENLEPQQRDFLERMHKAAGRMREMIDGLLSLSQVISKGNSFQPVDLGEVLHTVLDDLEILLRQTGGKVEAGNLPVIQADPLQMHQLFQNLVTNALKFHRPGAPPAVRVWASPPEDGRVEIRVEDNGIGFEIDRLDEVFQPFHRLPGVGDYKGSGIGLAICRKIVERHGGSISASSQPGVGSRFSVRLPLNGEA